MKKHTIKKNILITVSLCLTLSLSGLFLADKLAPSDRTLYSYALYDHQNTLLAATLSSDEKWRFPIEKEAFTKKNIPSLFCEMLIAFEDQRFYDHHGVDFLALLRAIGQWIKAGHVVSGGSTLTMQTVRLLDPKPRTIFNKIIEIFQAIGFERHHSKEEILALYLSLAPYGSNIEGIAAASWMYFKKSPAALTPAEMALLVVIPQHPNRFNPFTQNHKAREARNKLLNRLYQKGLITQLRYEETSEAPLPKVRHSFPHHAPHALQWFKKRAPENHMTLSTLDAMLQKNLETLLRNTAEQMEPQQTLAAVIIENKTGAIRAYVGSAAPWSEEKKGHVDMVLAIRSPGSALKPFIYGLAFEDNLIHPDMIINDVITNFRGYKPSNFRDVCHGEVRIQDALQQSLNIPVILLLDQLGPGRFVHWLESIGVSLYFPKKTKVTGLPVALGGVGIRFLDLVSLYVALAQEGRYRPLYLESSQSSAKTEYQLLKASSCQNITKILEGAPLPDGFADWISTGKPAIAFKTGTSYGSRDAVCVGYSSEYTVGVWAGRADGSACPNQLGRQTAAPVVLQVFQAFLPAPSPFTYDPTFFQPLIKKRFVSLSEKSLFFHIIEPQQDSTHILSYRRDGSIRPISIHVMGGLPPLTIWENGEQGKMPILYSHHQSQLNGQFKWCPPGPGFYTISISDGQGKTTRVRMRFLE